MTLRPIGVVRNSVNQPTQEGWKELESEIVLRPELADGLWRIEEFSHLVIIFWIDRVGDERPLKVHPRGNQGLPLMGVFATRAPQHPNPLGITDVELLGINGNVLRVRGLDALNGTPVLDIKPYLPPAFAPGEIRVPEWV
ncbi:MAG: tRNA (N6-threonylcarbamoyladenosine(37)-N6)-methyltransferase TrmO [Chloroflexi bacterium]|nr:tRNA (N6-threonylcarbamoyladenosine(37)-N6)-methyltransferase TrmO [Chloroflexota bacterium]